MRKIQIDKRKAKNLLGLICSMLLVVMYPCIFIYANNVGEGRFRDIWPAFFKLLLIAVISLGIALIVMRNVGKAWFMAELTTIILLNYHLLYSSLKKPFPGMRRVVFAALVLIVLLGLLVIIKRKVQFGKAACSFLGILFGVLIGMNMLRAIPDIMQGQANNQPVNDVDESIGNKTFQISERPNVYYMIFDEYGGPENLEHYYDFDNQEFLNHLEEQRFNVSYSSRNTESILSSTLIPDMLNLSYVVEDSMKYYTSWSYSENAQLYRLFQNNGYQINMINHQHQLIDTGCNVLSHTYTVKNMSTYILGNSVWTEIDDVVDKIRLKMNASSKNYDYVLRETLQLLTHCTDYTSNSKPTFTIAYFECPHDYFVFDQYGNSIGNDHITDWQDKSYYLNQLQYVNSVIEQTVDNILAEDPNAVIVIQSDHGARYPYLLEWYYGGPAYDAEEENPHMQNVLNCVYYQGNQYDIEGMSNINTWRYILNEIFGTDYEMLEPKQWNTVEGSSVKNEMEKRD